MLRTITILQHLPLPAPSLAQSIFAYVFSLCLLREVLSLSKCAAVALALVGASAVALAQVHAESRSSSWLGFWMVRRAPDTPARLRRRVRLARRVR